LKDVCKFWRLQNLIYRRFTELQATFQ